jgi:type IV pilus assembly protein PilB
MARSRRKLGEILVSWGVMTQAQAEQAAQMAKGAGKRLGDTIIEAGFAKEDQVAKALANQFGMEYVDLSANGVGKQINLKLIPEDLVKKHLILPLEKNNGRLKLIIHDPMDLELLDMLRFRLNV